MGKRNLLIIICLSAFTTSFAQNTPTSQPSKATPKEVKSEKQVKVTKSTIKGKPVKVEMIKTEKKQVKVAKEEKTKLEEVENQ